MEIHVMVQYGKAQYSSLELYDNGDRIESEESDYYYDMFAQPDIREPIKNEFE